MTKQRGHFVVYNHHGLECQRFYLHRLQAAIDHLSQWVEHSSYHMSLYSFKEDLVVFSASTKYFYVIPLKEKQNAYRAEPGVLMYFSASLHFMTKNGSQVWILVGSQHQGYSRI